MSPMSTALSESTSSLCRILRSLAILLLLFLSFSMSVSSLIAASMFVRRIHRAVRWRRLTWQRWRRSVKNVTRPEEALGAEAEVEAEVEVETEEDTEEEGVKEDGGVEDDEEEEADDGSEDELTRG